MSNFQRRQSKLRPINRRVIWPVNESRLFPVPLKAKSHQSVEVRQVCSQRERGAIKQRTGRITSCGSVMFVDLIQKHQIRSNCNTHCEHSPSAVLQTHPAAGMEGPIVRGLCCITLQRLFARRLLSDPPGSRPASLCHTWSQYVRFRRLQIPTQ